MDFYNACQRTANCLTWYTYRLHNLYDALFPEKKAPPDINPGRIAGLYGNYLVFDKDICPHCSDKKDNIINEIMKKNKLDVL